MEGKGRPVICRMGKKHIPAVARLERECFSEPWSEQAVGAELENQQAVVFVAELDGELVGYAGLHFVMDEGYITNIAVASRFRHRGIGRALLQAQKNFCIRRGFSMLTLEVRESNATAIGLYTSEGFSIVGKRRDFYKNPKEDGLIMTCFFQTEGK